MENAFRWERKMAAGNFATYKPARCFSLEWEVPAQPHSSLLDDRTALRLRAELVEMKIPGGAKRSLLQA